LLSLPLISGDLDGKKTPSGNHGADTEFMQGTADQDKNYVWNESVLENASAVSCSTAINRTRGSPLQSNKISDNPKGPGLPEEMARANETPLTPLFKQTTNRGVL